MHLILGTPLTNMQHKVIRNRCNGRQISISQAKFYAGEIWLMRKLWDSKKLDKTK